MNKAVETLDYWGTAFSQHTCGRVLVLKERHAYTDSVNKSAPDLFVAQGLYTTDFFNITTSR